MGIYKKVRELCKKNRISVSFLEETLGFPRSSICKWDKSIPGVDKIAKIANYFGVTIEYLLEGDEERKVNTKDAM